MKLPTPVAAYFAAEKRHDAHALAQCFADDAVVHDEGGTYKGVDAIERWNDAARKKYHHTVEPLDVSEGNGKFIVSARLSGSFPGSPITVKHIFEIRGDKIASMTIE